MENEAVCRLALTQIKGLGPVGMGKLLARFGSAEGVFHSKKFDWSDGTAFQSLCGRRILGHEGKKALERAKEQLVFNEEMWWPMCCMEAGRIPVDWFDAEMHLNCSSTKASYLQWGPVWSRGGHARPAIMGKRPQNNSSGLCVPMIPSS